MNDAVRGKALNAESSQSAVVVKIIDLLNKFDQWLTEIPPTEQPQRFGNKSFRTWYQKIVDVSDNIKYIYI